MSNEKVTTSWIADDDDIYMPKSDQLQPATTCHQAITTWQRDNWKLIIIIKNVDIMMMMVDFEMSIHVMSQKIIFLRAERRRREVRREKFTHKYCTLPTIQLGPAGRRPAWA